MDSLRTSDGVCGERLGGDDAAEIGEREGRRCARFELTLLTLAVDGNLLCVLMLLLL